MILAISSNIYFGFLNLTLWLLQKWKILTFTADSQTRTLVPYSPSLPGGNGFFPNDLWFFHFHIQRWHQDYENIVYNWATRSISAV
jgi:hypothetical protein